jgi:AI-2 transport protein TqsA
LTVAANASFVVAHTDHGRHGVTSERMKGLSALNASLLVIATGVSIVGLVYFADLLTPLALAIFLWLTIDAFADRLKERLPFVPRAAAVPTAVLLVFAFLAFVIGFVIEYARRFAGQFGAYQQRLDAIIAQVFAMMPLDGAPPTLGELSQRVSPETVLRGVADALQSFGGEALFVVIYVACLFAAQSAMPKKMLAIFAGAGEQARATRIAGAIRRSMEQYLWVQTVTGLMIAAACWVVFMAVGLDNALFWALVTFLLSYVPVVGGAAASVLPALFALVQFPMLWPALVILGLSQAIQFVVGNIIQPRMTGDSLNISVLVVFVSLAFWGKLWGGPGMFLAVPLTVMLMIVLAQFPTTRWIAVMMSNNGNPDASVEAEPVAAVAEVPTSTDPQT